MTHLGESGGLRDDAFQLAEIVGPEALLELDQSGFVEQLGALAGLVCDPAQQPRGEDGNVLDALAQRRDENFDGGEAGVEVLAELPYGGQNAQVAIGGGEIRVSIRAGPPRRNSLRLAACGTLRRSSQARMKRKSAACRVKGSSPTLSR